MKTFISHLPVAKNLSEFFIKSFEEAVPKWIKRILPYYYEAKKNGDAILQLSNFWICGTHPETYEKDGIGYIRTDIPGMGTKLAFNAASGYRKVNLHEFMPEDPEVLRSCRDFVHSQMYLSRLSNRYNKYRGVKDAVADYFRELTGDPDVVLDLGRTTYICWRNDLEFSAD